MNLYTSNNEQLFVNYVQDYTDWIHNFCIWHEHFFSLFSLLLHAM